MSCVELPMNDLADRATTTPAASPVSSSRGGQSSEGQGLGGLLATKFHIPTAPAGFVRRPRLAGVLDGVVDVALTLVCAPAGYGKTTLLADWSRRQELPVAWLSVDAHDNDPTRFWRHASGALEHVRPGVADAVASLLNDSPAGPAIFEGVVAEIADALVTGRRDVVWVVDDYHAIEADSVHASLRLLLDHPPPDLRVILASRTDPPLPLARWRARGRMRELRVGELRFTAEEAAAMLRAAAPIELAGEAVGALVARTEGWAAGLQLAGLSLRDRADVPGFVESFSGSHRYVLDYLAEEVLDHLDRSTREFLLDTCVLDRLSGPLCDALTGRSDSQQTLETIEAANLFLEPLDDVRGWWRYHQLFADLLQNRSRQQRPERYRELHRDAASWHEQHGPPEAAVHHALASGDAVWAAELIERYTDDLLFSSEVVTLRRWIESLPDDVAATRPLILLARTRYAPFDEAERLLDAAERTIAQIEPASPAGALAGVPALVANGRAFNALFRGDAQRAAAFAERASDLLDSRSAMDDASPATATMLAALDGYRGAAAWLEGRLVDAERAVAGIIPRFRTLGAFDPAAVAVLFLGQIRCAQGRLGTAAEIYQEALDEADRDERALAASGLAHLGLAEVAYQRDELDVASEHVTAGLRLCRRFVFARWLPNGLTTLAWIQHTLGDTAAALATMDEAERLTDPATVHLLNAVPAQHVRLLLARGDVDVAARWLDKHGIGPDTEASYPHERGQLARARVLIARGHADDALGLLDRLHAAATASERTGSVIEILALRSLALDAAGDRVGAVSTLAEALVLGAPEGYVRVFTDEGPAMGVLLGDLIAAGRPTPASAIGEIPTIVLSTLIRAFEHAGNARDGGATSASLVTRLTAREIDVLQLIAQGRQNQEIAAELYIALNTVKKHVTHIFEKLGTTNRTEATARARELGLLDT